MTRSARLSLCTALAAVLAAACGGRREAGAASTGGAREEWFTERAAATGLDFVHFNGASGEFYYPEILPPGVALFDYDNDGDLDVFVVQGQMLGATKTLADAPACGGRTDASKSGRDSHRSMDHDKTKRRPSFVVAA